MGAKIFDFVCNYCDHKFEKYVWTDEPVEPPRCPKCGDKNTKLKPSFGGYKMYGDNSSSITPKQSGSFKRKI